MPVLRITPEDMKAGKLVKPDWYHVRIKKVETKPGKKDQTADVYWVHEVILSGPFEGVPFIDFISEKFMASAIALIQACGGQISEEAGGNFELNDAVNHEVMARIEPGEVDGKMRNQVKDYRPIAT